MRGADFDEFVNARAGALLRLAYLLTGERHAAEDLLQDVLEQVYVRWPTVHTSAEAYSRQALVHRATNRWRWRLRRREQPLGDHDRPAPDASERVVVRDAVLTALRQLPARQRAAVVLRFLEDQPVSEVARILGCSEGAVKSHTARALERLRGVLTGTQFFDTDLAVPVTSSTKGADSGR